MLFHNSQHSFWVSINISVFQPLPDPPVAISLVCPILTFLDLFCQLRITLWLTYPLNKHDIIGYQGKGANGAFGLYFDDCVSSAEVYGNIFANISKYAITLGGGRDFCIYNNTFYRCKNAMSFDNRGEVWLDNAKLLKHLHEVPYQSEIWEKAYPALYGILDDEPKKPKGNSFAGNTLIATGPVRFATYCTPDTQSLLKQDDNKELFD